MSAGDNAKKPVKKLALVRENVRMLGVKSGLRTGGNARDSTSQNLGGMNGSHPSSGLSNSVTLGNNASHPV